MYKWVRPGGTANDQRLQCVKSLGRCDGMSDEDRVKCQSLLVEALLTYSKGKKNSKVFPYGDRASRVTADFMRVSSPTMSITLACMYPFIVNDQSTWEGMLKNCMYPIKQLWPKGILARYMHFNDTFKDLRKELCDAYEASGGVYHGGEQESDDADDDDEGADEEKEYENVDLECDKEFL